MKITFIVGLPGSGKTHLGASILASSNNGRMIDDFNAQYVADPAELCNLMREWFTSGLEDLIITDPTASSADPDAICDRLEEMLGSADFQLSFIPFENDVDSCWANVEGRNEAGDDRVISRHYLEDLSEKYRPARFGDPVPVYKPKQST